MRDQRREERLNANLEREASLRYLHERHVTRATSERMVRVPEGLGRCAQMEASEKQKGTKNWTVNVEMSLMKDCRLAAVMMRRL